MKKTLLAALAAPSLLAALAFSPVASAQEYRGPTYNGDAEAQLAYQDYQTQRRNYYGYGAPGWFANGFGMPERQAREGWQRRGGLQAAPAGYRWQRHGDRYALVRRSDGAIVQWR
ncbi:MAG: hypothetical protein EOO30_12260 [Comamonadaceae bacterium]|nr:MAG: hypothetical protein EOO30_12260 [Comamonadaceae bacterium]